MCADFKMSKIVIATPGGNEVYNAVMQNDTPLNDDVGNFIFVNERGKSNYI